MRLIPLSALLALVLVLMPGSAAGAGPDLVLGLGSAPTPTVVGDTVTVTATVRNAGDAAAPGTAVAFNVQTPGVGVSGLGCLSFVILFCSAGDLAPGVSVPVRVTLTGAGAGEVRVLVNASLGEGDDANPGDNQGTLVIPVQQRADLRLELAALPDAVVAGGATTVRGSVVNAGPGPAFGAELRLTLPPELPVLARPADCGGTALRLSCPLGTLASGDAAVREVRLAAPSEGSATVLGTAAWGRDDPSPANNSAQVLVTIAPPPEPPAPAPPADPGLAGSPAPAAPRRVAPTTLVRGLPAAGRCLRRRVLDLLLRSPRGVAVRRAEVRVTGRPTLVLGARRAARPFRLRLPRRGRVTVRLAVTLRNGDRLTASRAYRICARR